MHDAKPGIKESVTVFPEILKITAEPAQTLAVDIAKSFRRLGITDCFIAAVQYLMRFKHLDGYIEILQQVVWIIISGFLERRFAKSD